MSRRTDPPFTYATPKKPRRKLPSWVFKALIAIVAVAAAGGYLYYDPSLIEPYLRGTPLELPARTTRIYRWRDADGNLEHSNAPPPAGVEYEVIEVSSDTNVIPSSAVKQ